MYLLTNNQDRWIVNIYGSLIGTNGVGPGGLQALTEEESEVDGRQILFDLKSITLTTDILSSSLGALAPPPPHPLTMIPTIIMIHKLMKFFMFIPSNYFCIKSSKL